MLTLTQTTTTDLDTLFDFQTHPASIAMAAFTPKNPNDKTAYLKKWAKIIANPEIKMQTIRIQGTIVGSVIHFEMFKETNVSYWIDHAFWGKGIATKALLRFIQNTKVRPLYGRVAFDNIGSQKVLTKCGFIQIGNEKSFANARHQEIEEFVYRLD